MSMSAAVNLEVGKRSSNSSAEGQGSNSSRGASKAESNLREFESANKFPFKTTIIKTNGYSIIRFDVVGNRPVKLNIHSDEDLAVVYADLVSLILKYWLAENGMSWDTPDSKVNPSPIVFYTPDVKMFETWSDWAQYCISMLYTQSLRRFISWTALFDTSNGALTLLPFQEKTQKTMFPDISPNSTSPDESVFEFHVIAQIDLKPLWKDISGLIPV